MAQGGGGGPPCSDGAVGAVGEICALKTVGWKGWVPREGTFQGGSSRGVMSSGLAERWSGAVEMGKDGSQRVGRGASGCGGRTEKMARGQGRLGLFGRTSQ